MSVQGHPTRHILRALRSHPDLARALGKQLWSIAVKVPNTYPLVSFRLGGLHAKGKLRVCEF